MENKTLFVTNGANSFKHKKLIKNLKKGEKKDTSTIFYYYLNPVEQTLKNEINKFYADKIKKEEVPGRFWDKQNKIGSPDNLQKAVFEAIIRACAAYCNREAQARIWKELNALQHIFFKIEELPDKYRNIVKLRLQGNDKLAIAKELKLHPSEISESITEINDIIISKIMEENEEKADKLLGLFLDRFIHLII